MATTAYQSSYTGAQIDAAIGAVANKQDTLVSGTNIKTINNQSLLGSGDISISGGGNSYIAMTATWDANDEYLENFAFDDASAAYAIYNANGANTVLGIETGTMDGNTFVSDDFYYYAQVDQENAGAQQYFFFEFWDNTDKYKVTIRVNESTLSVNTYSHQNFSGGGEANVIESISVNNVAQTVTNKNVNITVPTKVSDLTNDSGFTSNTGTITSVKMNGSTVSSSGEADLGTVITSETSLSKGSTSGSGNAVTDLSVSGHTITLTKGKTFLESESDPIFAASAAYGISSSDITNWNGKTSNVGTITGITMNNVSKGTSGVVDLGTVITSHQDISGKADKSATVSTVEYNTTSKKITKTINGTTTDVVAASSIVTDGGGYIKPASGIPDTDLETSYLPTAGGSMSGDIEFNAINKGIKLIDSEGNACWGLIHNSTNLWVGAQQNASYHHAGKTFISTGYDVTNNIGYDSVMVSIPNAGNNSATEYKIYHTGNLRVSSLKEMRPSGSSLAGWYRVLQVTNAGTYAKSILFSIDEQYNNGAPTPSTFIINLASKGATIQQLGAAVTGPNHIKNIRVVGGTGGTTTYYIDLYYGYTDTSKWNRQGFSAMNLGHDPTYDTLTLIDWTSQAASDSLPSGEVLYASAPVSTNVVFLNGNVGIAVESPSQKLHVDGNAIITGTLTLGGNPVAVVYSGSSAPSSNTGSNGDIYIQTTT